MRRTLSGRAAASLLLAALTACSPTFNWRELRFGEDGMSALLPCKPDRATRDVALAGGTASLSMIGCEAGGATFTVARMQAADAARAGTLFEAWQTTMTARAAGGAASVQQPAVVARAAAMPAAKRMTMQQAGPDGRPVPVQMLWFAQGPTSQGVWLYQATVLGNPSDAAAVTAFFEGLRLP